jgi:Arc/MetJ-type ribon-helix-helix transcriptional regulator
MPSKGSPLVTVRLSNASIAFLDAEAERLGVTRSDVIRAALDKWERLPKRDRRLR